MASFSKRRRFGNFFGGIERLIGRLTARLSEWRSPDRYRPEKHYMRGPGPKNSAPKNSVPKNSVPKNSVSASSGKAGGSNSNAA
jgi:hypothetical protein